MSAEDTEDKQINRLRDMLVEEVSLVDLAANKRTFLVRKRRNKTMEKKDENIELKPDGDGGLKSASDTEPKTETTDSAEPIEKQNSGQKLQTAIDRLMSVANKVKDGEDPGDFAAELKAIMDVVNSVLEKYPSPTSGDAEKNETKKAESAPTEEPKTEGAPAPAPAPDPTPAPVEKLATVSITEDGKATLEVREGIEKGKRFTSARKDAIKGAVGLLLNLVKEMDPETLPDIMKELGLKAVPMDEEPTTIASALCNEEETKTVTKKDESKEPEAPTIDPDVAKLKEEVEELKKRLGEFRGVSVSEASDGSATPLQKSKRPDDLWRDIF